MDFVIELYNLAMKTQNHMKDMEEKNWLIIK